MTEECRMGPSEGKYLGKTGRACSKLETRLPTSPFFDPPPEKNDLKMFGILKCPWFSPGC